LRRSGRPGREADADQQHAGAESGDAGANKGKRSSAGNGGTVVHGVYTDQTLISEYRRAGRAFQFATIGPASVSIPAARRRSIVRMLVDRVDPIHGLGLLGGRDVEVHDHRLVV